MNEFERRSQDLFHESVERIDMRTRSQLTRARHAALDAAAATARRPWIFRQPVWTPAIGFAAVAALATAMWLGAPVNQHAVADQSGLDELEIVAASDGSPADAVEMLQDDLDFYDWADKAADPGPAA